MRGFRVLLCHFAAIGTAMLAAPVVEAAPYSMFAESDPGPGFKHNFHISYDTFSDFLTADPSSAGESQLETPRPLSLAGVAYDGQYRMLFEGHPTMPEGLLFHATFDTLADYENNTPSSFGQIAGGLDPDLSIGGFAFDGQYRVLLETDPSTDDGRLLHTTFATFDDLLAGAPSSFGRSRLEIPQLLSVGGFVFDGVYRLLLEADPSGPPYPLGNFSTMTFDTFEDFLANTPSLLAKADTLLEPGYSLGGFAYADPAKVSAPSTIAFVGFAFAAACVARRRKKSAGA